MELKEIIKIVEDTGVTMTIMSLLIFFGYKIINQLIDNLFKKKETDISSHSIFSYLKKYVNYKLPNLIIENTDGWSDKELEARQKISRAFLIIKFSTFLEYFSKLNIAQFSKLTGSELHELLLDNLMRANTEYEKRAKQKGIPEVYVNKFAIWHKDHINLVIRGMEEFCNSNYQDSNISKVASVLDLYKIGFYYTLVDAEKTINSINGDLTKWINENNDKINEF